MGIIKGIAVFDQYQADGPAVGQIHGSDNPAEPISPDVPSMYTQVLAPYQTPQILTGLPGIILGRTSVMPQLRAVDPLKAYFFA
ncbi:hypothetical protein DPF_2308 [Desulfoplanes formicivorans]|uniref:Uncharacterized protein n=1 Tax=Desulfoplanes formicivorans TaxID=1592317 RepID=A0A194ALP2_9BACT|nr:hypothetical protein DPF_2308 [Desulfoplanes formicivorans]